VPGELHRVGAEDEEEGEVKACPNTSSTIINAGGGEDEEGREGEREGPRTEARAIGKTISSSWGKKSAFWEGERARSKRVASSTTAPCRAGEKERVGEEEAEGEEEEEEEDMRLKHRKA
jgi:hypothetical protein